MVAGIRAGHRVRGLLVVVFAGLVVLVAAGLVQRLDQEVERDTLPEVARGDGRTAELSDALTFHDLRLPSDASGIQYTISSSMDAEVLGLSFITDADGLRGFLEGINRDPDDLISDMNPWEVTLARTSSRYHWDLSQISQFSGLTVPSSSSRAHRYAALVVPADQLIRVYVEAQEL